MKIDIPLNKETKPFLRHSSKPIKSLINSFAKSKDIIQKRKLHKKCPRLQCTVFASGPGDPRSNHAKDTKNGTWCHLALHSIIRYISSVK